MKIGLVIPTLNAEPWLHDLLPALKTQTVQPDQTLIIDSSSRDNTVPEFRRAGMTVTVIDPTSFDHGATRQMGADLLSEMAIVMFLTQDAIPASPDAFAKLLEAFETDNVGLVYGRQIPRGSAGLSERHARIFNYPAIDRVDNADTLKNIGIRAAFCSNSFSAYRTKALSTVGGFPKAAIFGEDMIVAIKIMRAGWSKKYVSSAVVIHSHSYAASEEFKRYFDIGVMHEIERESMGGAADAGGEGLIFLGSELKLSYRENPFGIPNVILRNSLKYIGYKAGRLYKILPRSLIIKFSMNKVFWRYRWANTK